MEEQFEYGEEVLVRDHDNDEWQKRHYLMTAPEGKFRYFTVHSDTMLDGFRISQFAVYPFAQMRKIQKPEPELIDIEQPETEPLFISTQGVCTAEEVVMQLQERIEKISEELKELKTQIK